MGSHSILGLAEFFPTAQIDNLRMSASNSNPLWIRIAWIVAILVVVCIVAAPISMRISTVREMQATSGFLDRRPSELELQSQYGQPRKVYPSFAEIPVKFQRGLHVDTNCVFYLYTKEGLPYWYFVAAVDSFSKTVLSGVVTNY